MLHKYVNETICSKRTIKTVETFACVQLVMEDLQVYEKELVNFFCTTIRTACYYVS